VARAAAALVAWVAAAGALALEIPPAPTRYLTDLAGVVPGERAAQIEATLAAIEQRTGHQVVAVTFPSLEGEALEDFTMRVAEQWKVGRRSLDDGVIFFAFIAERRLRLEVGYGLEGTVTDALSSRLLAATVKPAFREGDYGAGILALATALESVFRGDPPPAPRERRGGGGEVALVVGLIVLLLLLQLLSRHGGSGSAMRRGGWSTRGGGRRGPWDGYGGGFGGGSSGGGFGGGSFGGFSSGGGSFGGGGASGSW